MLTMRESAARALQGRPRNSSLTEGFREEREGAGRGGAGGGGGAAQKHFKE